MSNHPLRIFSGSAHPALAQEIAGLLGASLGKSSTRHMPDSEIYIMSDETLSSAESRPAPPAWQSSSAAPTGMGCLGWVVFSGLFFWVNGIAWIRAMIVYGYTISPQILTTWSVASPLLIQIALLGLPLIVLAALWREPRGQAIFRAWALAVGFNLALLPMTLARQSAEQAHAGLHIGLALVYCALLLWLARRVRPAAGQLATSQPMSGKLAASLAALLCALLVALPWLAWGAFGSLLDTLLQTLAALSLGLVAGLLISDFLLPAFPGPSWGDTLLAGLASGVTLLIVYSGSGFGFGGMQLILMTLMPSLAWAIAGLGRMLSRRSGRWLPLALLAGFSGAAPMALIHPLDLILVVSLGQGEILQWAITALGASLLAALACGLLAWLAAWLAGQRSWPERWPALVAGTLAAADLAVLVVALGVYFLAGRPGLYGDHMFVILRSQPDLSAASSMSDYNARRRYVYQTLTANANATQNSLRQDLQRWGIPYTPYYLVNGIDLLANPLLRLWLASRPEVDRVLDSPHMRPLPTVPPTNRGPLQNPGADPWNLKLIGADRVQRELGITGKGIVVGQSDTGADGAHPELAASYRGQGSSDDYNWLDPWNGSHHPTDIGGHGTHTLGTMVGKNVGVAPGAAWIACVNLARNLGNPPVYLNCMQFMLAPYPQGGDAFKDGDPTRGAQVINNSWGCPDIEGCDPDALLDGVRALRAAGVFVVASAGNDGPKCETLTDPLAIYAQAFSVGAIDQDRRLTSFSSIGPVTVDGSQRVKPDILAPGQDVLSAMPGGTYDHLSGTSMAGPHLVGVVALMWSANPALIGNIDLTEQILEQTAQPYRGPLSACKGAKERPSTVSGYGIVDAYAAVQKALTTK